LAAGAADTKHGFDGALRLEMFPEDPGLWMLLELNGDDLVFLEPLFSSGELLSLAPPCLHPWIGARFREVAIEEQKLIERIAFADGVRPEDVEPDEHTPTLERLRQLQEIYPRLSEDWSPSQPAAFDAEGMQTKLDELCDERLGRRLTPDEFRHCIANGVTFAFWRDTSLEDAHVEDPELTDAQMMAGNVATARAAYAALEDGWSAARITELLTDPQRPMPDGRTAAEWLGEHWPDYLADIDSGLSAINEAHRQGFDPVWYAFKGFLTTEAWADHPLWDRRVAIWFEQLSSEDSELPAPPDDTRFDLIRDGLLDDPSRLSVDWLDWCLHTGIDFVHASRADPR